MAGTDGAKEREYPLDLIDQVMNKYVDGELVPKVFPTECILAAKQFRNRDGDVVIATYPKAGTTWMMHIVCNLLFYDQYESGSQTPPTDNCIHLEMQSLENAKPGGPFTTHLPFGANRFNPKAKYIVVLRNPRDVCVSYYHHYNFCLPGAHEKPKNIWFPLFAKMFTTKKLTFGDYFEHALSWVTGPAAAGANDDSVLYVTYEKMKANPREELIRVANFIGGVAAERVKDSEAVDKILSRTSVSSMKKEVNPSVGKLMQMTRTPEEAKEFPDEVEFVRKGEVGDWKNHFSPEISAEFDAYIKANPENEKVMKFFEE